MVHEVKLSLLLDNMKRLLVILLCLAPFILAGGGDFPPQQEQRQESRREWRQRPRESGVNWTTVLVAGFGCLGACVPAFFTYRAVQKRRHKE